MPDLESGGYALYRDNWLLDGQPNPTKAFRQSLGGGRFGMGSDLAALTTQVMLSVAVAVQPGDEISKIAFMSGATAAGTPTNYWFALYDDSATPALLAQTADQTSTAWAAKTVKDLALNITNPILVTKPAVYRAAIMVKATAVPTLYGTALVDATVAAALISGQSVIAQTSGSALTTTAPATVATPTAVATVPWCLLH